MGLPFRRNLKRGKEEKGGMKSKIKVKLRSDAPSTSNYRQEQHHYPTSPPTYASKEAWSTSIGLSTNNTDDSRMT